MAHTAPQLLRYDTISSSTQLSNLLSKASIALSKPQGIYVYLQQIKLVNTGPVESVEVDCRFSDEGNPLPLVIVGKNGSGKSIFLAHIVSAMMAAQGAVFEDADVETGKIYKLRSPVYIRHGASYSIGKVNFSKDFQVSELQLKVRKAYFNGEPPEYEQWANVPIGEASHYFSNMTQKKDALKDEMNNSSHLYFPPNRFEEPAWLNEFNLKNKAKYFAVKNFSNFSDRPVVHYSPFRDIKKWLLDLIYDNFATERVRVIITILGEQQTPQIQGIRNGPASKILIEIENLLLTVFDKEGGTLQWHVGKRSQRTIGVSINNKIATDNLFGLSTGQAVILGLFLTLLRDFDLSHAKFESFSDVIGTVVVDEVDMHLHSDLQHDLLPKLMKLFPKVQFILTTHSPLFLLGMEKAYSTGGFQLIELPTGLEIEVERFSEFEAAYKHMQESTRFQSELRTHIAAAQKPILIVEDKHDAIYKIAFLKTQGVEIEGGNFSELFEQHAPFEIRRAESAGSVAGFLGMNNTDGYDDKKVVGLFDFDKEGTECFYHLKKKKNWDANISGDPESGVFKKRNQHDCFYSLLLPVPDRHKELISSVENGKFGSYVEIENLLPDEFLAENDLVEVEQITGSLCCKKNQKQRQIDDGRLAGVCEHRRF
ncbi:AAA family ATPase [Phaeobacter inhibens]|uniref:ATP-binding protein n=1 Tax=Phaeobacter inhibens TaxID=221822 RepID=UPI0021A48657|nr:ATP-binding protein [Phaeobacter inhibens]UWR41636.1 AAA family ATPase [Phaeobacter inhibens]